MKPFLIYSLMRVGLLVLALGLGALAGLEGAWLIIAAFLGSGLLSFIMLDKQRQEMGGRLGNVFTRINARIDANTRKEDID